MSLTKIDKLVNVFISGVIQQTESLKNGENGNEFAKKYIKAFRELKKIGDAGREALVPFLLHERDDVRGTIAAYLLRYKHSEAMNVLQELSKKPGFDGFAARETIKRWNEGVWELDKV